MFLISIEHGLVRDPLHVRLKYARTRRGQLYCRPLIGFVLEPVGAAEW